MSLKSLDDHNKEAADAYSRWHDNSPRFNGIACPDCGNQLMDSSPNLVLTSIPPQTYVHCPYGNCGYKGTRVA